MRRTEYATCLLWERIDSSILGVARSTTWFLETKFSSPLAATTVVAEKSVVVTTESPLFVVSWLWL